MKDPTRDAAFDLLDATLERRRPLEEALDALPPMPPRDRAAGHRLAAAVLRRMGSLDAVIEPFLKRAPPPQVLRILRIGAAGLLLLETPPHAAVATAVSLARSRGFAPFAGLVNAVLRRVAEHGAATLHELDGPRLDTPAWLWKSWGQNARAIAEAHLVEAPLDLSWRPGMTPDASDPAQTGMLLPTGSWRYPAGTRVMELPGFAEGDFWVQDAAATLPAGLLAGRAGERVADLCAAPGGKTAQLTCTGAHVVAVESHPGRMARLRENLARLRLDVETVQADATAYRPDTPFDAVLLDAPCSATGTIRRHPDVMQLKRPRDVQGLVAQQDRLIDAAFEMLRPGGRLVYAVCSLQPEEGEARVEAALARLDLTLQPFAPSELEALPEALTAAGHLRTRPSMWPDRGGMDGFFAARMIRG